MPWLYTKAELMKLERGNGYDRRGREEERLSEQVPADVSGGAASACLAHLP